MRSKLHSLFNIILYAVFFFVAFVPMDYLFAGESSPLLKAKKNLGTFYIIKKSATEELSVIIQHEKSKEYASEETIICSFFRSSKNGSYRMIGKKISGSGFPTEDMIVVGDFLKNGRKQVLVATFENNTHAEIYDFDGKQIQTVYNSEIYDGRMYLNCVRLNNGQLALREEFHTVNGKDDPPAGSIYVKNRNVFSRVICWKNGKWEPIKIDKATDKAEQYAALNL